MKGSCLELIRFDLIGLDTFTRSVHHERLPQGLVANVKKSVQFDTTSINWVF